MRIVNTYTEFVPPDNPRTAEEIRDLCCTDVPSDPCAKTGRVSDYQGAEKENWDFDPDQLLEQARADNPGKRILSVRVEGVGNRPGKPCGKKYESWTGKNNCCDFVEPMAWDDATSVDVLAPETRGIVGVSGGAPPYYWSVRGEGFALNEAGNIRDGWTDTPYVWIYATIHACGRAPVEVTDGCSIARGVVISTNGSWIDHGADTACHLMGPMEVEVIAANRYTYLLESGGIRQRETLHLGNYGAVGQFYTTPDNCGDCPTNPATVDFWQGYQPFSDLVPCNTSPPSWWPCRITDVLGDGSIIRYVCSPVANRSWEEWRC